MMKLRELLTLYPWDETLAGLMAPERESRPPRADVSRVVDQQRRTQVPTLARYLSGTRLEGDFEDPSVERERHAAPELRAPESAARLFLGTCAQAGAVLRTLDLAVLGPADRSLGRLLVLVSFAESNPRERDELRLVWRELGENVARSERSSDLGDGKFGAVLTPMILAAVDGRTKSIRGDLVEELVLRLSEDRVAETPFDGIPHGNVVRWTRRVVRSGADRLWGLSAKSLVRPVHPEPTPPRREAASSFPSPYDLQLVGPPPGLRRFVNRLREWPNVERVELRAEWDAEYFAVRVWSHEPLSPDDLGRLGRSTDVRVVEVFGG
jgi:hypothetical protein